jgi:hypothetical protein
MKRLAVAIKGPAAIIIVARGAATTAWQRRVDLNVFLRDRASGYMRYTDITVVLVSWRQ